MVFSSSAVRHLRDWLKPGCYGVTTNRENSIEFDGLGWRKAGVGGSAAVGRDGFSPFEIFPTGFAQSGFLPVQRRHDPLAPDSLDFHETSIEFDPTCDLVIVFPVPLHWKVQQFSSEAFM
ncbi:hypothetical protein TREMEDRAFT_60806 [Tremella mesenterica DSM 1558]|uniref:uncharacterized protein n=1 Tax=Tremella mesenterica (strain ATCC 24925 / CBS 8224 / DSM 1558 / NBRC 9311 / NRRL Y-6157 / RJB 2259-6 / UBC 559-6) TaxID=578456 RepID=UPI0003F498B9|nr:uncharacterized protein TREMEDRAFT_60806 [Tremella mesenterica DSM 1558]EIW71883.1 hypothetical protein TREMEDRAFT_60806 [Tremella mesenterica DSM 1558]